MTEAPNHQPSDHRPANGQQRDSRLSRRGFLRRSAAAATALGLPIVFWRRLPANVQPIAWAAQGDEIPGKDGLTLLGDRPLNAETPAHLLDDRVTPASRLFVRNNGWPPDPKAIAPAQWTLSIGGESIERPTTFGLPELKAKFEHVTLQLLIECGGNGRSEFRPPVIGNQWSIGAVGCPQWTGVRLRDVLKACGIKPDAVYIGYHGADQHLSRDPKKEAISRGVPIEKALEAESLIAWAMNGEDMPLHNGHPLRLVVGGWPASTSGKWLTKIDVRNCVHDGTKMGGKSYRVPKRPVQPGSKVPDSEFEIIESMPVKSLITHPRSGLTHAPSEPLAVRGHAWAGDLEVRAVEVSIDFGSTWQPATLDQPVNRLAWQHWHAKLEFPEPGYYEIWARATDTAGASQPMVIPGWNPKGYLNNACHRIAVQVRD